MAKFSKGDTVEWNWASGTASGTVEQSFTRRVQRTIKGRKIVRNGSTKRPAYLLSQKDGTKVLKLESELSKA
ncbi:DUF2945 domain-containing protein [Falsirhodobacter sp. alg1]|nr:DUF2945 domain-containing protein [Falsirhodobacter sp. alg1]